MLGVSPVVFAQADEGERERMAPDREEARRVSSREMARMLDDFYDELIKALNADEEFAEELSALFDEHIEEMREQEAAYEKSRREHADAMRALVREMREAHEQGDRERAAELRKEISELRRKGAVANDAHLKLFDEIRGMLDEEQIPVFDKLAAEFNERLNQGEDGRSAVRLLHRAVGMLELSDEQKERIRNIFLQARRDAREAEDSQEGRERLAESIKKMIVEELDEDQVAEFNRKLEELAKEDATRGGDRERVRNRARSPETPKATPGTEEPGAHEDEPASEPAANEPGAGEPAGAEPAGEPEEDPNG
jgi:hypothetical protein